MLAEGFAALRVAADTRGIPEILHLRPCVQIRRNGILATVGLDPRRPPGNEKNPSGHRDQRRGEEQELVLSRSPRPGSWVDCALHLAFLITGCLDSGARRPTESPHHPNRSVS